MELKKYNNINTTLSEWDRKQSPYYFTVEWESIDEPGTYKNFTGSGRETGLTTFNDIVEKISNFPNCLSIRFIAYGGKTGNRRLLEETISTNDRGFYPVQQVNSIQKESKKVVEPTQQQAQPLITADSILGALLGFDLSGKEGGLNGTALMGGLLTIRDKSLRTEYDIKEYQREISDLKLKLSNAERDIREANERIDELDSNNEELLGQIDELTESNQALQKYVPENSPLGISLAALGSSILNGFVKKVVSNNPQAVANLLGTDTETLNGLFGSSPEPTREIINTPTVSVELSGEEENATPQRKSELEAINRMVIWLKSLNNNQLSMVLKLMQMWAKDNETLEMQFNWAMGNKQE